MTSSQRTSAFEIARLKIVHLGLDDARELERTLEHAAAISALTLDVARVGIWVFTEDRQSLSPLVVLDARGAVLEADELPLARWPQYAAAITERRILAADDVCTDPRTCELANDYLIARGITSMLDVPIFIGGNVWGIVCHEHVGPQRTWQARETDFAVSVADMLSALFEQAARLQAEKKLRAREHQAALERKNEALVRFGAGVAHDFKNVLQTIMLVGERAVRETEIAARKECLRQVLEECGRGNRLVIQLLDFAQATPERRTRVDLASVVAGMSTALTTLVGGRIRLDVRVSGEVPVDADVTQLERTITNLVVNARDAMPDGGTISVATEIEDGRAALRVTDHGIGMDDDVLARVFEPFFTTKQSHGGTGLGLATVAAVAEHHGGTVAVASSPGHGSTFTVFLPLASP
jgi:signal transduction histidine kinase